MIGGRRLPTNRRQLNQVYATLLGRAPRAAEIDAHQATGAPLHDIAATLAAGAEHERRLQHATPGDQEVGSLAGSAAAMRRVPPGTVSEDERAIMGRDGWGFISAGTNATVRQFEGALPLDDAAFEAWARALDARVTGAAAIGARLSCLVVPDKLAILPWALPLTRVGPRPIEQLQAAFPGRFLYPAEDLRAAGRTAEIAYRTDSHISLHGAQVVFRALMADLGLPVDPDPLPAEYEQIFRSSALGKPFRPSLWDVQDIPVAVPDATVESNETTLGLHRGVMRVSRNPRARHRASIVVIGDSYCFPWRSGQLGTLIEHGFAEAHYLWNPMGWDSAYIEQVRPDHVVLETAERFIVRPPAVDESVQRIAARALAKRTGRAATAAGEFA